MPPRVEKLGVGQPSCRLGDVVGADEVERPCCVGAGEFVFREGGLVEDADGLADVAMLVADGHKPILASHGVHVLRLDARRRRTSSAAPSQFEPNTALCAFSRS